jgi:predicted nucleotidyltransferase
MIPAFSTWINEKVEYNRDLSPKFWEEGKMDPIIRKKLLRIAEDFWDSLKLEVPIMDIQLTGSLANFNWNKESDLDVHIIIDFGQIDENLELVRKALDGQRFIWNSRHPVKLRGHDVECYVQHKDEQHIASGLFSILKDRWLIIPSWNEPKIDQRDVKEKVRVIKSEISIIAKKVKSANSEEAQVLYDYLARLKKKIMSDRKDGLARDGEFAVENLVFKELRRSGAIEKIIDLGSDIYYKIYSE